MENIRQLLPQRLWSLFDEMLEYTGELSQGSIDPNIHNYKSEWKGYRFHLMFNPDTAKRAYEEYEFERDSVVVASFPKAGRTWMLEIVRQILYGHDEKLNSLSKLVPQPIGGLDLWRPEALDLIKYMPIPRKILRTHLPEELVNFENIKRSGAKVIVIVRNPKDLVVSWFHFTQGKIFDNVREQYYSPNWDQFYCDFIEGKHPLFSKPGEGYPEYLRGWCRRKNEKNVLFVNYEEMRNDTAAQIRRLANFLGQSLTEDAINSIVCNTSIENMKKKQEDKGSQYSRISKSLKVVRKGKVGSWKETFTVAQSETMDKLTEEKLGNTDIQFIYE